MEVNIEIQILEIIRHISPLIFNQYELLLPLTWILQVITHHHSGSSFQVALQIQSTGL